MKKHLCSLWEVSTVRGRKKYLGKYRNWYVIYCLKNIITNKVYIGQTGNLFIRIKQHINASKEDSRYLYKSMRKYGLSNFTLETLFKSRSSRNLDKKERQFIEAFESYRDSYGYNITLGGKSWVIRDEYKAIHKNTVSFNTSCWLFYKSGELFREFSTIQEASKFLQITLPHTRGAYYRQSCVKDLYAISKSNIFPGKKKNLLDIRNKIYTYDSKDFFTLEEISKYIGISVKTLRKRIRNDNIQISERLRNT